MYMYVHHCSCFLEVDEVNLGSQRYTDRKIDRGMSKHIAIYHIFAYIAFWLQSDIIFPSCRLVLGYHLSISWRSMVV